MTYSALSQKVNTERLKDYMEHLKQSKDTVKPFTWNVHSFLPGDTHALDDKKVSNLVKKS